MQLGTQGEPGFHATETGAPAPTALGKFVQTAQFKGPEKVPWLASIMFSGF